MWSARHFHVPELGEFLTYIPGKGILSFDRSRGAAMFELQAGGVKELWSVPDVWGEQVYPLENSFLVRDSSYSYYLLTPSDGRWQVWVNEQDVTDEFGLLVQDGLLFADLNRAATCLELYSFGLDTLYIVGAKGFVKVRRGDPTVERDGLVFPLSAALYGADGSIYVPIDVFSYVGWVFEVDRAREQVRFRDHWGWWY